jgi:hypothetical protein
MQMRRHGLGFVITLGLSLLAGTALANTSQSKAGESAKSVSAGVWGGQSLNLEVTAQGATLEFDCATGKILEPLVPDANGKFRTAGKFQTQGGPVRKDKMSSGQDVVFSGVVQGDTIQLEFTLAEDKSPEKFTLVRGQTGRLHRCY